VQKAVTVNRPPAECYRAWRDVERLPTFMRHIESVRVDDDTHSHWCATAPGGRRVEWDAEITDDRPNRLIAWRSLPGSEVDNCGSVHFAPAPGGKGTVLEVRMEYRAPAGGAGALVARLVGEEPGQQVDGDLRRFKQLLETGEIPTTKGQSHGPRTLKARLLNKELEQ
jgi:uncharacterized membrane protein